MNTLTPLSTAAELLQALRRGQVGAVELADAAIARIEQHDGAINAVVVRDFDRARAAARDADTRRARGDDAPLLGLPLTVKESFNAAGLPTTWGLPGTRDIPVGTDAVALQRLRAAGAVLLGKTNVATELADWQSDNVVYGRTVHPLDATRTPGGSSGGGAAALAAGFVPLEMGSDLFGSLRVPAHWCGVCTHKPSFGIVPLRGHVPPGVPVLSVNAPPDLAVAGPMARSADDLALMLDVLAGADDAAPAWQLQLPPPRQQRLADFRVLLLCQHPALPVSAETQAAFEALAATLRQAGCQVQTTCPALPDLGDAAQLYLQLMMALRGADIPEPQYRELQRLQAGGQPLPAPAALLSTHRDWIAADRRRMVLRHRMNGLFSTFDVIVCPVSATPAVEHDPRPMEQRSVAVDGQRIAWHEQALWCTLASVAGLPATVVPLPRPAGALPIGVQIVGPMLEDRTPLAFARLLQAQLG
jgi:amidase